MKRAMVVVVVVLFSANCAVLVWLRVLPNDPPFVENALSEAAGEAAAQPAGYVEFLEESALSIYQDRDRQFRRANVGAFALLIINTFFVFGVGLRLSVPGPHAGLKATELLTEAEVKKDAPPP